MTEDHHAADRGRQVRTPQEIRDHINADHPCCIGVGDAVALLQALDRRDAEMKRVFTGLRKALSSEGEGEQRKQ
jgi:hypothetical protein